MPLDPGAIRLLDRVSCLVVDVDLLFRDEFELEGVKVVASVDGSDPERIARRLFDRRHPKAKRRQGGWTLAPLAALGLEAPAGSKRLAARMAKRGLALGLAHRGRLVALAGAARRCAQGPRSWSRRLDGPAWRSSPPETPALRPGCVPIGSCRTGRASPVPSARSNRPGAWSCWSRLADLRGCPPPTSRWGCADRTGHHRGVPT